MNSVTIYSPTPRFLCLIGIIAREFKYIITILAQSPEGLALNWIKRKNSGFTDAVSMLDEAAY